MSNTLDSGRLSDIIETSIQEIVNITEEFIDTIRDEVVGDDRVTLMINGKEIILSKDNYDLLKAKTDTIKFKMKAESKVLTDEFKASIK